MLLQNRNKTLNHPCICLKDTEMYFVLVVNLCIGFVHVNKSFSGLSIHIKRLKHISPLLSHLTPSRNSNAHICHWKKVGVWNLTQTPGLTPISTTMKPKLRPFQRVKMHYIAKLLRQEISDIFGVKCLQWASWAT